MITNTNRLVLAAPLLVAGANFAPPALANGDVELLTRYFASLKGLETSEPD